VNRLLILRHAKSDWGTGGRDFDRPLNADGRAAATAMGPVVRELAPDLVLCSPARRTRETLEWLELACPVQFEDRIYDASVEQLLELVGAVGEEAQRLLLIGHMPGVARLAAAMSESDEGPDRARLNAHYPTAALTVVDFEGKVGRISRFVGPKDLA
jgi:phosphohistidine phosphatase